VSSNSFFQITKEPLSNLRPPILKYRYQLENLPYQLKFSEGLPEETMDDQKMRDYEETYSFRNFLF